MTKEEFIQKAVLTLLANNSGGSAECITGFAKELADAVYGKENVVEKNCLRQDLKTNLSITL